MTINLAEKVRTTRTKERMAEATIVTMSAVLATISLTAEPVNLKHYRRDDDGLVSDDDVNWNSLYHNRIYKDGGLHETDE